ncbi:MAG: DUF1385 domain-containing protein [Anaerolineae bacterium]|nr:DUF1385 domain-containing protein [Anaerolineae bacterium]
MANNSIESEALEDRKPLGETYGGQAVIEGVMMRGKHIAAIAVRRPDGEIVVKEETLSGLYSGKISKIPFLRGLPLLWDSLGLGMRALFFSAEVVGQEEDPEFSMSGGMGIATAAFSLLLGVGLFMVLPSFVAGLIVREQALLFNVIEGLIRLMLLIGYIAAIGQTQDIRRVFAYHGAEHKTINAYENGAPLTVDGVRPYSRQHARCGTAFLLTVVLISVLVLAPLGRPSLVVRILTRLALLPVIAGISYEILRFTARNLDNGIIRALIAPNLALQNLTTREPDDAMLEVAIRSLQVVLSGERQAAEGAAD